MQAKKKQGWRRAVYHVLMLLFSFLMLYPLLWMISSSLKPGDQIMITQTQLIPAQITLKIMSPAGPALPETALQPSLRIRCWWPWCAWPAQ